MAMGTTPTPKMQKPTITPTTPRVISVNNKPSIHNVNVAPKMYEAVSTCQSFSIVKDIDSVLAEKSKLKYWDTAVVAGD